ncbi:MAG: hypothetical protein ABGW87_13035 [Sphingomonadaceae bacterium]
MRTIDLKSPRTDAARLIGGGAVLIASSVLADSAMEHYRGSFANPAMVAPLAASTVSIAVNSFAGDGRSAGSFAPASHAAAAAVGTAGLGFHVYNILRQPGGLTLSNLFYQAPIGAPAALVLAGTFGSLSHRLSVGKNSIGPIDLGSGRWLAALTAFGIMGTVAEAGLLHFRGAFHNPAMWLPITLPSLSAAALAKAALTARGGTITTALLAATAAVGLVGAAFHAYGVSRNMGGWKNWRQNLLAGPPLSAPPAFTGLAIIGLGAMLLMSRSARG